jgi:hypothetical protein
MECQNQSPVDIGICFLLIFGGIPILWVAAWGLAQKIKGRMQPQ